MLQLFLLLIAILFFIIIISNLNKMSEQFNDLKAKLQAISETQDTVKTSLTGIADDVTFLKSKIEAGTEGGLTAEEALELSGIVDGLQTKVGEVQAMASGIDAETDSTAPAPGEIDGDNQPA